MDAQVKPLKPVPSDTPIARPSREEAEAAVRTLIAWAGDDPDREGLLETPARVAKAYGELFAGYDQDAGEVLSKTFKEVGGYDDLVLVKGIPFYAHCEHHMVPFYGQAHIAYLPGDYVVGISKLARVLPAYANRLQVQERLTVQIADLLSKTLVTDNVAVVLEARHMCVEMRGVKDSGAETKTMELRGKFNNKMKNTLFQQLC